MKHAITKVFLSIIISLFLIGCQNKTKVTGDVFQNGTSRPYLRMNASQEYVTIPSSEVDNQYDGKICYDGVSNVCIVINEEVVPLEQAVKGKKCSIEEVIAYAQEDARNGICAEGQCTYNGLTRFTYTYPEYMLITIHDVYETPDGNYYTINDFTVTVPKELTPTPIGYSDLTTGAYLDLEDWGIVFTPIEVSSENIFLETTQRDGQNFGDLFLTDYYLVSEPDRTFLEDSQVYGLCIPIAMGNSGRLQLDLNQSMQPGDYTLVVRIEEIYNKEDMPSLMRNYHDTQQYLIPVTIP